MKVKLDHRGACAANPSLSKKIVFVTTTVALALSALLPSAAFADVRKGDVILGETVEDRDLAVVDCPDVTAERVYVVNRDGEVFFERNSSDECKIASVTKIMTALVALDSVPEDFVISVSDSASDIDGSSAELEAGDQMALLEALKALMIPSGNDAAQAIAESVGGSLLGDDWSDPAASAQAFVDAMNAKAEELDMSDTLFENAHGLDDEGYEGDHHSTAHDAAILSSYAMKNDTFREIVAMDSATCVVTREGEDEEIDLDSTDELLGDYEGACGIKTGFTDTAGGCFAGACNRDESELYSVVFGSEDEEARFADTEVLWDWVYDNLIDYNLAQTSDTTIDSRSGNEVPLVAQVSLGSWMDKTVDATLSDPDATVQVFKLQGNISQTVEYDDIKGTVYAGDKVGTLTFKQHNEVIATMDMIATQDVLGPKWYESVAIWFKRIICKINDTSPVAESILLNEPELINDKGSAE